MTTEDSDDSILCTADKIIQALKERRSVEINELAGYTCADIMETRKIVNVLEKEGLARVEYKLTKSIVIWEGEGSETPAPASIEVSGRSDKKKKSEGVRPERKYYISEPMIKLTDYATKNGASKNGNGKTPVNVASEEKKPIQAGIGGVLKPLNVFIPEHAKPEMPQAQVQAQSKKPFLTTPTNPILTTVNDSNDSEMARKTSIAKPLLTAPKNVGSEGRSSKARAIELDTETDESEDTDKIEDKNEMIDTAMLSMQLNQTIKAAQQKKQEITELNKKEAGFLQEKYVPLTKKLELEIGAITEMIIEKEKEITQQKDRARALTEQISNVEVESLRIHDSEIQARKELENAMVSLEKMLDKIREIRKGLNYEVKVSKKILIEHDNDMKLLNASIISLSDNEKEIERKIFLARSRIEEEEKGLDSVRISLNEMRRARETIRTRMNEIHTIFSPERFKEIEDTINGIAQLESKLDACRQEYSDSIQELRKANRESAESVEKLRDIIQSNFVRKAAKELDTLGKNYEEKMSDAFEDEKKLRRKIDSSREELRGKVEYAQQLSRMLKAAVPQGKDITDAKLMEELREIEKEYEREGKAPEDGNKEKRIKILEDIKSAFSRFKERLQKKNN